MNKDQMSAFSICTCGKRCFYTKYTTYMCAYCRKIFYKDNPEINAPLPTNFIRGLLIAEYQLTISQCDKNEIMSILLGEHDTSRC